MKGSALGRGVMAFVVAALVIPALAGMPPTLCIPRGTSGHGVHNCPPVILQPETPIPLGRVEIPGWTYQVGRDRR